jgi:hypothetical protein
LIAHQSTYTPHHTREHSNYHYISATLQPQTKIARDSPQKQQNITLNEILGRSCMKSTLLIVALAIGPISGCVANDASSNSARQPLAEGVHVQRMVVLSYPPIIAATQPEDIPAALSLVENIDPDELTRRESARWVNVDSLPLLTSTASGRRLLSAAAPRALARGMPAEICPADAMASAAPGSPPAEVVGEALRSCLAKLGPGQTDCGCQIVAIDNLVTVPLEDAAYATGTSARMRSAALGIDLLLVAEENPDGDTLLRDLQGPVARLTNGENGAVTLIFEATKRRFDGYRITVGFRRGRIAERVYVVDADGHRLSLLIGFEPGELAEGAGAWLAWPPEG